MHTKAPALLLAAGAFVAVIAADGRSALEFAAGGAVALAALVLLARTLSDSAVFIFGVLCVYASSLALAPDIVENNGKASYTAVVETASVSEKSQRAVCTLLDSSGHRRSNRRIGITVADIVPQIEPGDIVRFNAELRPTERYADIPHMAVQGFTERSMRLSAKAVVFKDDISVQGHSSELRYIPDAIKSRLEDFIHASSLTPQAAGMLAAATLGSDIDSATKQEMRDAGIAHLLCISGFHVGVLAAFVSLLLWPLVLSHGLRRYRSHITLCCVWFYALIVGFTPSVVRAAIMVSSFLIARMMQRDTLSINALALAFFIVLFIDPFRMYSAGFQLSFAAVAALLLFADRINPIPRKHPTGHRMASAICTPLAAMTGTAPLMMLWFNKLPLLGILANAMTTVLFPLFMGTGAICVILDSAGIPCGAIASATQWLNTAIIRTGSFWSEVSNSISPTAHAGAGQVLAVAAAIVTAAIAVNAIGRRNRYIAGACLIGCITAAACTESEGKPLLMADTTGTASCILTAGRSGTRCYVTDGDSISMDIYSHILAAHRNAECTPKILSSGSRVVIDGRHIFHIVGKDRACDNLRNGDIIFLCRNYKGEIGSLIGPAKPSRVIISGAIAYTLRKSIAAECSALGILCHDLAEKAVNIE